MHPIFFKLHSHFDCSGSFFYLHQFVGSISFRQFTTVVSGSHYFTISTSRNEGAIKSPRFTFVQVNRFSENIRRFTDRSYYIVCLQWFFGSNIFHFMECLIQSRTDKIGHTCIQDGKFLPCALFYIQNLRD